MDRTALILYGTETGNAQDVAEELGRLCQRLRFDTTVREMNAVELIHLCQVTIVVCVLATTGQGQLPANARKLWRSLLRSKLRPGVLQPVRFTSFGLGDSSYPQFNWAARKLHKRLRMLGAQEFCPRGEADEQHADGIDTAFLPWSAELRAHLLKRYPVDPIPDDVVLPPSLLHEEETDQTRTLPGELPAVVTENKRVTPASHWQDVRLLTLQVPAQSYPPGVAITIYPQNVAEDVSKLIDMMGWEADRHVTYNGAQTTLRELLTTTFDITAIPRRSFLKYMAHFATDATHQERLLEFANPAYSDEFYDYTTRPRRSIIEVLEDFPSVKIPWDWAGILPCLRGRQYSVAGVDGQHIQILAAIVKYRTVIRKIRQGVCSRYLAALPAGSRITISVTQPNFVFGAAEARRPLLMIAPGTGVAPMRALIQERARLSHTINVGRAYLIFGGRNRSADFFFHEEWDQLTGGLEVWTAFSRDQPHKIYVQDVIREQAATVQSVMRDGIVYVCGSSGKMPLAVRAALLDVMGSDRADAAACLAAMEKDGRYVQETW